MKTLKNNSIALTLFLAFVCAYLHSQEQTSPIVIDKEAQTVTVNGDIQLKKGILEFAAASKKTNREYESFILLKVAPSELNKALEQINLKPNQDAICKITIEWKKDQTTIKRDLSEFFQLNDTKAPFKGLSWKYTGGKKSDDNNLTEDINGEIIGLQPSSPGILVATQDYGNPYDESEKKGFSVNQEKLLKEIPELAEKETFPIQLKIEINR